MLGFFAFLSIVILFILLMDTRARLKRAEATLAEAAKRIGALQRHAGLLPPKDGESPEQTRAAAAAPVGAAPRPSTPAPAPAPSWVAPSPETIDRWKPRPDAPTPDGPVPEEVESEAETEPQAEALPAPVAAASAPLPSIEQDAPVEDEPAPEEAAAPEPVAVEPAAAEPGVPEPAVEEPVLKAKLPEPEPPAAPPPGPPPTMASRFENLFGKTLPIWAGGITLAIAGVLIVRYAIDAGFFARVFTPGVQVIAGMLFGLGLIGGAEYAWRNEDKVRDLRVPQALSGAGIATLYAAILVAANVYGLIGPLAAFVGLAIVTAGALGLSLRFGPPSALLGLAGGLAAPALVGAMEPNVPLLAVYLGLTIAGLTGVARMRRWPWLALAALVGGVGWSLWMVLATSALDTLGSLSIGGFVLLLALALPMIAFDGPRAALLRAGSAIVGALQLALLVGIGGFAPLHWGLFILIAAAGQWLAWREKDFAIVPSISLALSVLLLAIWPDPTGYWFILIGLALAAIHALPLLARLWAETKTLRRTLELCGLALAAVPLVKYHFWDIADAKLALVALGAALTTGAGIALGWKVETRTADGRFAWLTGTTGVLVAVAALLVVPHWTAPFAVGAVAAALLFFGKAAKDKRIEPIAAAFVGAALIALIATPLALVELPRLVVGAGDGFAGQALVRWGGLAALLGLFAAKAVDRYLRFLALTIAGGLAYGALAQLVPAWSLTLAMGAVAAALFALARRRGALSIEGLSLAYALLAVLLLASTGPGVIAQWTRLYGSDEAVTGTAILRWGVLTLLGLLYAVLSAQPAIRRIGQVATALLVYGALAQVVPGAYLMLVPALGGAAMLLAARRIDLARVDAAAVSFAALSLAWAVLPVGVWATKAVLSLGGVPMLFDASALAIDQLLLRLLLPALLFGAPLLLLREKLPRWPLIAAFAVIGILAGIALHCLYRLGFAAAFGGDFVATGVAQRIVWGALLVGGGWLAMRRGLTNLARPLVVAGTAHAIWYGLLLHNPLWTEQAVGSLPLANWLAPLFLLPGVGLVLIRSLFPDARPALDRIVQVAAMLLVAGFAWATLRQIFHGSLLIEPGVTASENILRSILILALAIGFLLWGIRQNRHDWRIASLILMLGAVGKVFLFDASGLEGLLRIGSFVVLGFSLIGIGWLYSRQLARPSAAAVEPPTGEAP